ncbi:uncharacterized protein ACOB8E_004461 [Sarcophilus harrisii]
MPFSPAADGRWIGPNQVSNASKYIFVFIMLRKKNHINRKKTQERKKKTGKQTRTTKVISSSQSWVIGPWQGGAPACRSGMETFINITREKRVLMDAHRPEHRFLPSCKVGCSSGDETKSSFLKQESWKFSDKKKVKLNW